MWNQINPTAQKGALLFVVLAFLGTISQMGTSCGARSVEAGKLHVHEVNSFPTNSSGTTTPASSLGPKSQTFASDPSSQGVAISESATAVEPSVSELKSQTSNHKETPSANEISVNSANEDDLMRLPGIGQNMADRIISVRQAIGGFRQLDDLRKVKGIGAKKLANIAPYINFN